MTSEEKAAWLLESDIVLTRWERRFLSNDKRRMPGVHVANPWRAVLIEKLWTEKVEGDPESKTIHAICVDAGRREIMRLKQVVRVHEEMEDPRLGTTLCDLEAAEAGQRWLERETDLETGVCKKCGVEGRRVPLISDDGKPREDSAILTVTWRPPQYLIDEGRVHPRHLENVRPDEDYCVKCLDEICKRNEVQHELAR